MSSDPGIDLLHHHAASCQPQTSLSEAPRGGKTLWWDVEPILKALRAHNEATASHGREITSEKLELTRTKRLGDFAPVWQSLGLGEIRPSPHDDNLSLDFHDNSLPPDDVDLDHLLDSSDETKVPSLASDIDGENDLDESSADSSQSPSADLVRPVVRDAGFASSDEPSLPHDLPLAAVNENGRPSFYLTDTNVSLFGEDYFSQKRSSNVPSPKLIPSSSYPQQPVTATYHSDTPNEPESDVPSSLKNRTILSESARMLVPAWVTPDPIPLNQKYLKTHIVKQTKKNLIIEPLQDHTPEDKMKLVTQKLAARHHLSAKSLRRSHAQTKLGGSWVDEMDCGDGVHVFIDCSNIMVGFHQSLKKARNIDVNDRVRGVPIMFDLLALILERGRPVARRVLAGSVGVDQESKNPKSVSHFKHAEALGYEVNILQRVAKRSPFGHHIPRKLTAYGTPTPGPNMAQDWVMAEQCVDEILQMKMLESIVDARAPSTMVVATGDGAPAEFSSGFLTNIERALEKGWKVELVTWKGFVSYAYRSKSFQTRWGAQFKIIELDDYLEELMGATYDFHSYSSA